MTFILGTARLNFGTRSHFFWHGTPDFCRVNAKVKVCVPKILGGPFVSKNNKMAGEERKSRVKLWPDEATRTLINLWSEETIQLSLENCKTSKETRQVYNTILVS